MTKPELTVSIPTYNEAKNVELMIIRVCDTLRQAGIAGQALTVPRMAPRNWPPRWPINTRLRSISGL